MIEDTKFACVVIQKKCPWTMGTRFITEYKGEDYCELIWAYKSVTRDHNQGLPSHSNHTKIMFTYLSCSMTKVMLLWFTGI